MRARKNSSGFLLFACLILLAGKILTGQSEKLQRKSTGIINMTDIGAYDDEPATVDEMHRFMEEQGYALDITDQRMHHEIYLSDARRVAPEKRKTVVRHPIRRA